MRSEVLRATSLDSPVGEVAVVLDSFGALVCTAFLAGVERTGLSCHPYLAERTVKWTEASDWPATEQLRAYFRGERRSFELDLAAEGTPFQKIVWRELERIPYGQTISYGELARRAGSPGASRAVGQASHVNPLPIVVPCHRVLGADGALTGFAGGVAIKQALLDMERGQAVLWD